MGLCLDDFLAEFDPEFKAYLTQQDKPIYVGLSGGVDSVVLLHLLVQAGFAHRLKALHIHHGLSNNADAWFHFCESLCEQYKVAFQGDKVSLNTQKHTLEEAARIARYQVFEESLNQGDYLLLGHHAGDQAETLMFRLLRGTGGKGLAGMPVKRSLACGQVYRPLLGFDKASLIQYAKQQKLKWVEDESNQDETFSRNHIRHRIIPRLQEFEAKAERRIEQAARRLAFDYQMLAQLSQEKLTHWQAEDGSLTLLDISHFEPAQRLFWLRQYLALFSISLTQAQMQALDASFFSEQDKQPCFNHKVARLMRYQGRLYVLPLASLPEYGILTQGKIEREFDSFQLSIKSTSTLNLDDFCLAAKPASVILSLPNGHSRKLKKWFNDEQVPIWWREQLPYLYYQEELIAIADLWINPNWSSKIQIQWQPKGQLIWPKRGL